MSLAADWGRLMETMADGLRTIHAIPTSDCPFKGIVQDEIREAQRRIEAGELNVEAFVRESGGRSPGDVLSRIRKRRPMEDDLVFTHGDFCMPNILIEDWKVSGYVDWATAGVADRHRDLLCVIDSVTYNCGKKWLPRFLDAYGVDEVDQEKIAFFSDLDLFYTALEE